MADTSIDGAKITGLLRLTWVSDHLAHVLEHSQADEPAGTWTGLACPGHGLAPGTDVDTATLLGLSAPGDIADLIWEAPADLAAGHGQLLLAAIQAYQTGQRETGERLWQQAHAIWTRAWSANYEVLKLLQAAGLTRFSPVKPQRWVIASFEHHCGPHGLPHPHVHNIVITPLTTGTSWPGTGHAARFPLHPPGMAKDAATPAAAKPERQDDPPAARRAARRWRPGPGALCRQQQRHPA